MIVLYSNCYKLNKYDLGGKDLLVTYHFFSIAIGSLPSREGTPMTTIEKANNEEEECGIPKRKLSFSQEEAVGPAASPEAMPGEIFQLENIVEEPNINAQRLTVQPGGGKEVGEDSFNQSIGSSVGHQLETSITSNTSIPISETSAKERLFSSFCFPFLALDFWQGPFFYSSFKFKWVIPCLCFDLTDLLRGIFSLNFG